MKEVISLGRGKGQNKEEQHYVFHVDQFPEEIENEFLQLHPTQDGKDEIKNKFFRLHSTQHCKIMKVCLFITLIVFLFSS